MNNYDAKYFALTLTDVSVTRNFSATVKEEYKAQTIIGKWMRAFNFVDYPTIHRIDVFGTRQTLKCVRKDFDYEFRDFAWSDSSSLTLHQSARIERTEKGFQICIYNHTDYDALLAMLENRGFSLPTADEWAYLCGGGCQTLFPWGDGLDYSMRLRWFEDMDEDENRSYDMEEPNFFGLSIAYDPYMREVVQADRLTTCGGDGGCNICGGLGPFLGFLPCSPDRKSTRLNSSHIQKSRMPSSA